MKKEISKQSLSDFNQDISQISNLSGKVEMNEIVIRNCLGDYLNMKFNDLIQILLKKNPENIPNSIISLRKSKKEKNTSKLLPYQFWNLYYIGDDYEAYLKTYDLLDYYGQRYEVNNDTVQNILTLSENCISKFGQKTFPIVGFGGIIIPGGHESIEKLFPIVNEERFLLSSSKKTDSKETISQNNFSLKNRLVEIVLPEGSMTFDFNEYEGILCEEYSALVYLATKHKDLDFSGKVEKIEKIEKEDFKIFYKDDKLYFPKNFFIDLKESNKRFFVIPFEYTTFSILLYDRKDKTLERFIPNGFEDETDLIINEKKIDIDEIITTIFFQEMGKEFINTYFKSESISPYYNIRFLQTLESDIIIESDIDDYSTAWCYWYIDFKLSNSDIESKELVRNFLFQTKKKDLYFTPMIRDYSNSIRKMSLCLLKKNNKYEQSKTVKKHINLFKHKVLE
jgi:hypothetical protein